MQTALNTREESPVYGSLSSAGDPSASCTANVKAIYHEITSKLKKNAQDGDELDIFQVTSFLKYYNDPSSSRCGNRCFYIWFCFKCWVCFLVQTFGMIAFLSYVIKTNWDENKFVCSMEADWDLRTVATLLTLYISVMLQSMILNLKNQGLYERVAYLPSFLANEWVYVGLYSNAFTLMAATIGSFVLIYTSETTIDIVLNALALYFIVDVDNQLVSSQDYTRIQEWMEKAFPDDHEDVNDKNWFNEEELRAVKFINVCGLRLQVAGRKGGCNQLKLVWVFFGGIFVYLSIAIGLICGAIAPILIAVCY